MLSLKLHSSTGQLLGMAGLSPLTTHTQHIPRLNSDLWGQVKSPSGFSSLTAQVWAWLVFTTQKPRAAAKQNCLLTQGLAHGKSGAALRQKEKAPLECNCVLNYFNCCYFPFFATTIIFHISSVRWIICYIYFFPPKQEARGPLIANKCWEGKQ